jgi:toxin CptA
MPNSTHSSSASAHSRRAEATVVRIDWRPSRWLSGWLAVSGPLAAAAVLASEMPAPAAWPLALAAAGYGPWLARREVGRPVRSLVLAADADRVEVDGQAVTDFSLQWRGPLAFAAWRDARGRRQRLAWWPGTLPPARRRELRLAAPAPRAARRGPSMAP